VTLVRKQIYTTFARELRANQTDAERQLWMRLRDRRMDNAKFRRQYSIGPYIVDFCSIERRLVIELDGGQHVDRPADRQRDAYIDKQGFRVVRFWNNEVLTNMDGVLQAILDQLQMSSSQTPC
jgi:very-short-patch-repair endonuclease